MPADMEACSFARSEDELMQVAADALALAKEKGADAAAVSLGEDFLLDACVRAGSPERVSFSHGIDFAVKVFLGQKAASSSCNSLSRPDVETAVARAVAIAREMQDDDCEGLPAAAELADPPGPELDVHDPWRPSVDEMVRLATEMAEESCGYDGRVSKEKSEGAGVDTSESRDVIANSLGFMHAQTSSSHGYSCSVVADIDGAMESAGWGISRTHASDLSDHLEVARTAAKRAVDRAGLRPVRTAAMPVLFEAGVSHALVRSLLATLYGGRVFRGLSCFADAVGKQVAAPHLQVRELPLKKRGRRSGICDSEGVAATEKDIVKDGVLQTHLLDCYSARKLKSRSTGNKGGVSNVEVGCRKMTLEGLLGEMGSGLFVTGLMGGGANPVTGDYSAGAYGFMVEGGEIAHPVKDATIAGALQDMLKGIVAGGDDVLLRGGMECGSILVGSMSVAGGAKG